MCLMFSYVGDLEEFLLLLCLAANSAKAKACAQDVIETDQPSASD